MRSKSVVKLCAICGNPFKVRASHAHKRFNCSKACQFEAQRRVEFDPQRLWSKVAKAGPDDCWLWQSQRNKKGYGQLSLNGKPRTVTRIIWKMLYGEIPESFWVLHSCDNPPCCNPAHLFLGLPKANTQDMLAKGRDGRKTKPENFRISTAPRPHIPAERRVEIYHAYTTGAVSYEGLALQYHCTSRTVARIVHAERAAQHALASTAP
jgi:HNH endonuclease